MAWKRLDRELVINASLTMKCEQVLMNGSFIQSYTNKILGPPRILDTTHLVAIVSYAVILTCAIIGNVLMAFVLMRRLKMRNSSRLYLLNLLVSDLLLATTGIPFEMLHYVHAYPWPLGEFGCILRCVAAECASYVTILTITMFTFERYLAVARPVQIRFGTKAGALLRLSFIWILSMVPAILMGTQFGVALLAYQEDPDCVIPATELCLLVLDREIPHSLVISTVLFFFVPMATIVSLHTLIVLRVRESDRLMKMLCARSQNNDVALSARSHTTRSPRTTWLSYQQDNDRRLSLCTRTMQPVTKPLPMRTSMDCGGAERTDKFSIRCRSASADYVFAAKADAATNCEMRHFVRNAPSVNKMLIVVSCCFFVCFCPFMLQRLFARNAKIDGDELMETVHNYLFFVTGFLYYSSAAINPVVYGLMSKNFRSAILLRRNTAHAL